MIKYILLIILVSFFALNMGGSNSAASFAAAYGCGIISKRKAQFLFGLFVFLGAIVMGYPVVKTLGTKIVPQEVIDFDVLLIVLISAATSLFIANLLNVPQSTSLVTVVTGTLMIIASILGVLQSFVMIKVASVFAIGGLKNGYKLTFTNPVTKKTYFTWIITPIIAVIISFLLTGGRNALFK